MSVSGEMNLKQWVETLPKIHRVRLEYLQLTTDLSQAKAERDRLRGMLHRERELMDTQVANIESATATFIEALNHKEG